MAKNKKQNRPQNETPRVNSVKTANTTAIQPASGFQLNNNIAYGLLAIGVIIAFSSAFGNDFVNWDDQMYATENKMILKPTFANLMRLMGVECALNYHPVTMASLWLNSFLFGQKATPFIVVNVLIHALNTILIFRFTQKLTNHNTLISFFVALIWGVHPMHVESVVWVSERKDVLYTMFFFLACLQYVKFIETDNRKYYFITLVLFVLACLSKAMAVVLPVVLILIDFWFGKSLFNLKNYTSKIPFFIVSILFGALAVHVQGGGNLGGLLEKMTLDVAISDTFSLWQRLCFGFYGFMVYIFKFFIPVNLHNFYAYPPADQYNNVQYMSAPFVGLILLGLAFVVRNKSKESFFGFWFFFITIALVLQFLSVGGAILAERYSYVPYFGLAFTVFYLLNKYVSNKSVILGIGAIAALVFMFRSFQMSKTYKDTGTLFLNSYQYEPLSGVVNENLANHYGRTGNIDLVIRYGDAALQKGVQSYALLGAMGNAWHLKGDNKKALQFYEDCIRNSPDHRRATAYYNRGIVNRAAGNYEQSAKDFSEAMKRTEDSTTYLSYRAYSNLLAKNYQSAINDYTSMISKGIAVDTAYNNRAVSRYSLGDPNGAISDLKQALKINPNYAEVKDNLNKLGVK
ncbi:MAG: tetratricopeptide repeat protein [Spirosomaceae bacterium]|jgi:tetratricopeptide (TPR) repeat protein|nr:tetratricopeptide repeat protein [Spirosomataceae bacterium]